MASYMCTCGGGECEMTSHTAFTVSCDMNKGAGYPHITVMLCLLLGHMINVHAVLTLPSYAMPITNATAHIYARISRTKSILSKGVRETSVIKSSSLTPWHVKMLVCLKIFSDVSDFFNEYSIRLCASTSQLVDKGNSQVVHSIIKSSQL